MSVPRFLISSLAAAGFGQDGGQTSAQLELTPPRLDPDPTIAPRRFSQDHFFQLASHRSHSSHSSHRSGYSGGHYSHSSHTSHRSGVGGYDYSPPVYTPPVAPAPVYRPPQPAQAITSPPRPQAAPLVDQSARAEPPPPDGLPALSGRSKRFQAIVRRVQLALMAQDFYRGPIDGVVSPAVRKSLRKFQAARSLAVTGTVTPQTLDAMMIAAQ